MTTSPAGARLLTTRTRRRPAAVALVLHGGADRSGKRVTARNLAVLRLRPVAWSIARTDRTVAVHRLQFSTYGWNGTGADALRDTRWALDQLRERYPRTPIVLVGHSMGGRVALRLAGEPDVAGAVCLAPWAPDADPVDQLAGVRLRVAQGARDAMCPVPSNSRFFDRAGAAGARVERTLFPGLGHFMLKKFWVWHGFADAGVRELLP